MNRDIIRARFRHYRQQIENLNGQLDSQHYYAEEAESDEKGNCIDGV